MIINYFKGTLRVKICGSYLERFFNICSSNDILIWDIERIYLDELHVNISVSDYKKLSKIIKNTKCTAVILKKQGFFVLMTRLKYRYVFFLGLLLCIFTYFYLNFYIWDINISGTSSTASVYDVLKENDINVGKKLSYIDQKLLKNEIMSKNSDFLWVSVNIFGNTLDIDIKERDKVPESFDKNDACDIVAEKSGLIDSIDVLSGEKMISVGETFMSGDVLVSSEMLSTLEPLESDTEPKKARFVHSSAEILANIWYDTESFLLNDIIKKQYTGREYQKVSIIFLQNSINLYKNSGNPYDFCDKIVEVIDINLSDSVTVPISIRIETFYEYIPVYQKLSEDFSKISLENGLNKFFAQNISGDILEKQMKFLELDGAFMLKSTVKTLESIGIKVKR